MNPEADRLEKLGEKQPVFVLRCLKGTSFGYNSPRLVDFGARQVNGIYEIFEASLELLVWCCFEECLPRV